MDEGLRQFIIGRIVGRAQNPRIWGTIVTLLARVLASGRSPLVNPATRSTKNDRHRPARMYGATSELVDGPEGGGLDLMSSTAEASVVSYSRTSRGASHSHVP
jgi:hypothetical protein